MISSSRASVYPICFLALVLPAFAQLDSATLHARYGAPLNRETFSMPQGFDLVVDYGAGNQVCKLLLPALMPTYEKISNADQMRRRMYDFLAELAPPSMRGKELRRIAFTSGMVSVESVEYQQLVISESRHANEPFSHGNVITVTFQNENCKSPAGQ